MNPYYEDDAVTLYAGDCIEVMRGLPDASVDAVVTDPPYGLEFMGKEWDSFRASNSGPQDVKFKDLGPLPTFSPNRRNQKCPKCDKWAYDHKGRKCECGGWKQPAQLAYVNAFQAWCTEWATEALRVLKPGGHFVAFGGTRTWHRLTVAVEDAGFEIRDSLAWLYGSGFPKGSRVNRDERFCQCAATAYTSSDTSPEQPTDDRTRTGEPSGLAAGEARSAQHETSAEPDSQADCLPGHGSSGGPLRPAQGIDPELTPSPECAPARSHSDVLVGGQVDESSRTPSPARRSGHPSNLDSALPVHSLSDERGRILASTSPADTSESDHRTRDNRLDSSPFYGTAFPPCWTCGKPNADGWNVALKPAYEPIVLARKPLSGTVAATVLEHGTGALNIDGCRVGTGGDKGVWPITERRHNDAAYTLQPTETDTSKGRWPANVILDADAAAMLDAQSGVSGAAPRVGQRTGKESGVLGAFSGQDRALKDHGDTGGASRFFYTAKADQNERPRVNGVAHPTVKPLDLMRWLVRLVTPPGGLVLEPFAGSGTTAEACVVEGFRCIAIEREPDYLPLIVARLSKPIERTLL